MMPRYCPNCGIPMLTGVEICPHHGSALPENWARFNKAICDFIHRGVPLPPAVGLYDQIERERAEALSFIARERTSPCPPTACD